MLRLPNWRRAVFISARSRARISPRFRVHDLQHTAAPLMIQAGYPPKMLQEIMGHASITTTLDLYGHLQCHPSSQCARIRIRRSGSAGCPGCPASVRCRPLSL